MKKTILVMMSLSALLLGAPACEEDGSTLTGGGAGGAAGRVRVPSTNREETAGAEDSTYSHANDPAGADTPFPPADPAAVRAIGSPELTSRLHSCGKLSVTSLGKFLESRGITGTGTRPQQTESGKEIFDKGETAAALGGPNYTGRVPEAPFASTSAVSKMYDIFMMGSYDVIADGWNPPACPGVKLLQDGKFTKDAVSCLIGKPATDEYVAIANDAIVKSPKDGAQIAVAAMLAAAHTCQ